MDLSTNRLTENCMELRYLGCRIGVLLLSEDPYNVMSIQFHFHGSEIAAFQ